MVKPVVISRDLHARQLALACRVAALTSFLLIAPPFHVAAVGVVLFGPLVLAPVGYELSLLFVCLSVICAAASWAMRRFEGAAAARTAADGEVAGADSIVDTGTGVFLFGKAGGKRAVRWLANGITVLALSVSVLVAGFECLLVVPYVADPVSPAGDRVVVVERNVLLAGHGDVYLVRGGFGMGRKIASYSADDGYSPMDNGTYALEWRGSEPRFTAYGTPANPVGMHPAE